jgi:hypothetical protein
MKLGIAGRIAITDVDLADTIEAPAAQYLCYTDVVVLLSSEDESCNELGQDWLYALHENDGPSYVDFHAMHGRTLLSNVA